MKNFSMVLGMLVSGLMAVSAQADCTKAEQAMNAMKGLFAKAKAPTLAQLEMGRSWNCIDYQVSDTTQKLMVLKRKNLFVFKKEGVSIANTSKTHVVESYQIHDTAMTGAAYGHISAIRVTEKGDLLEQWMNSSNNHVVSYTICPKN